MGDLIKLELYKMHKKKYFIIVILFNSVSLLYGLGIKFNWSWVLFNGKFDIIQYVGAIWQLLFLIGLPLIFFMYVGSSLLGGEKEEGQILLEITRVADRKKLVKAKLLATISLIVFYYIINIVLSTFSYFFLVRYTKYATLQLVILNEENINLFITSLFGCVYIVIIVIISMYLSIKYGAIISTIGGVALYAITLLLARMDTIRVLIPGYFALATDAHIDIGGILQQLIWSGLIILIFLYLMGRKINSLDL